jgi:uncharacterized protein YqjF (DUF2071 family)
MVEQVRRSPHDGASIAPLFRADWVEVVFTHFAIGPRALQPVIPFELDTRDGLAYVSLVAFTQKRLRPAFGGRAAALLARPMAEHAFLNLRTYVRHGAQAGIYFITEWIPNRLAVLIGPRTYGLPYRLARLYYRNVPANDVVRGEVIARDGSLRYRARLDRDRALEPASAGSIDHFLLERYVAFTHRGRVRRRFEVDHAPWPQARAKVELLDPGLLCSAGAWTNRLTLIGGNYSPGVHDVLIGAPAHATDDECLTSPAGTRPCSRGRSG